MNKKLLFYFFSFSLLIANLLWSQQEVDYILYRYHLNLINPATTGTQGAPYLRMSLRSQWMGIENSPETQAISIGTPNLKNRLGTGFSIIDERAFAENTTQLFLDFSYRLPLDRDQNIYLGLKAGGTSLRIYASELKTYESDLIDPLLLTTSNVLQGERLDQPEGLEFLQSPRNQEFAQLAQK
jgi:type IX secretion system PorP/SprF family membrane protein